MRTSILGANGQVVNIVELGEASWSPPAGHAIGPAGGEIGDRWDGTRYVRSLASPAPEPSPELQLRALLDAEARRAAAERLGLAREAGELAAEVARREAAFPTQALGVLRRP